MARLAHTTSTLARFASLSSWAVSSTIRAAVVRAVVVVVVVVVVIDAEKAEAVTERFADIHAALRAASERIRLGIPASFATFRP